MSNVKTSSRFHFNQKPRTMSNLISNIVLEKANTISTLLRERDIIVDLTQLIDRFSTNFLIGYYFEDSQGKIIAGKVIDPEDKALNTPTTWITIPLQEIPQNAVTLSFFMD